MKKMLLLLVCVVSGWLLAQEVEAVAEPAEPDPLNAVVRIDTKSYKPNYWQPWLDHGQDAFSGSGVVIAGKRILTNAHNLVYATYITVSKRSSDEAVEAHVKVIDHDCDLALLEVDDPGFFADIQPLEIGETPPPQTPVAVAGYPIGGDGLSITQGVISRIEPCIYLHSFYFLLAGQLDAAVNPGNSGGPVISDGTIVGIVFQGSDTGKGLGYMIPSEIIRHFLKDIEDGRVDGFGRLGFRFCTLDNPETREFLKMRKEQTGVRVSKIESAAKSYIQMDDVLLAVDGVAVSNSGNIRLPSGEPRELSAVITQKQIGEMTSLTLLRQGKELTVEMPIRKIDYQCKPYLYDKLPDYYIIGGFVFTTLSHSFLDEWGKNDPPEALVSKVFKEKETPDQDVIVLTAVLADKVNKGYQGFASAILHKVNDRKIRNLMELVDYIDNCQDEFITFYLDEEEIPATMRLKTLREQTPAILKRYRVPADRSKSLQK